MLWIQGFTNTTYQRSFKKNSTQIYPFEFLLTILMKLTTIYCSNNENETKFNMMIEL